METEAIYDSKQNIGVADHQGKRKRGYRTKPIRTRLSTTLDAEIHKRCVNLAEKEGVSLSVMLDHLLGNALSTPGPKRVR